MEYVETAKDKIFGVISNIHQDEDGEIIYSIKSLFTSFTTALNYVKNKYSDIYNTSYDYNLFEDEKIICIGNYDIDYEENRDIGIIMLDIMLDK
jgi:hypothetical protein